MRGMTPPRGPDFNATAPAGISYPHSAVEAHQIGVGEEKLFLFQPARPSPASAPVVVLLHGWFGTEPGYYRGWIDHLCRSGKIVIFPCYQGTGEPMKRYTGNAARSIKEAFRFLFDHKRMIPDRDQYSLIGHESGAVIAANLAATARPYKLPVPGALFLIEPSRRPGGVESEGLEVTDLSGIVPTTKLVLAVGEDDSMNGIETARDFFYAADNVPLSQKNFLTMLSDMRGTPALVADHLAPLSPLEEPLQRALEKRRLEFVGMWRPHARHGGLLPEDTHDWRISAGNDPMVARAVRSHGVDAMDFLGLWRVFDDLWNAAFAHDDGLGALDEGDSACFMGVWSNGTPIRGFLATKRP